MTWGCLQSHMTHVRTPLSSGSLLSSGVTGHWSETLHKAAVTPLLAVWHKRHEAEIVRKKNSSPFIFSVLSILSASGVVQYL